MAAKRLEAILAELDGHPNVRPGVVRSIVADRGRHYRAVRVMHPQRPGDREGSG